jgi:hypothetical protein
MSFPDRTVKQVGNLRAVHESWQHDWWFYKSIGSKIRCEKHVKRRRWWCLWLCQRWVWDDYKAELMSLFVGYFHKRQFIGNDPRSGGANGVSEIKIELTGGWFGSVQIPQDGGPSFQPGGAPPLNPDGLEPTGVQSEAKVEARDGNTVLLYSGSTGAGDQP